MRQPTLFQMEEVDPPTLKLRRAGDGEHESEDAGPFEAQGELKPGATGAREEGTGLLRLRSGQVSTRHYGEPGIFLGTSSFTATGWAGTFYPEGMKQREFLSYYATRFAAVEIDSTFYGTPAASAVTGWKEKTPADFIFAVKVPQLCGDRIYVVMFLLSTSWQDMVQFERYISLGRASVSGYVVIQELTVCGAALPEVLEEVVEYVLDLVLGA
jgi:hypothetical protein